MNEDRGMIKWAPFASVTDPNSLVSQILNEKDKISMPSLSEDLYYEIESDIKYSLELSTPIEINYFKNGKIIRIKETVLKVDINSKTIYFSNNIKLKFNVITQTKR